MESSETAMSLGLGQEYWAPLLDSPEETNNYWIIEKIQTNERLFDS